MGLPLVGVTVGDPAGIGPEIVAKAVVNPAVCSACSVVVYGHPEDFQRIAPILPSGFRWKVVEDARAVAYQQRQLHPHPQRSMPHEVREVPLVVPPEVGATSAQVRLGQVSPAAGRAGFAYFKRAVQDATEGLIDAVATAPINKAAWKAAGVPFLDHTEMLAHFTRSPDPMTMFVTGNLRIFFVTRHVPLRKACELVTTEGVFKAVQHAERYLRRLGFSSPRLAVAALNPHAGEGGLLGDEETREIVPAVAKARREGIDVVGPVAADAVFVQAIRGRYDAVISLYHDQGHIAAKVHDFDRTVSVTLGLPFIRSSVDHGTAFDVAGKGIASEASMVEAIRVAAEYAPAWKSSAA